MREWMIEYVNSLTWYNLIYRKQSVLRAIDSENLNYIEKKKI